jgi:hypothetical protein
MRSIVIVGSALVLASLTSAGTVAPQQTPTPTPTPAAPIPDLSGRWVTNDGQAVVVHQEGRTVNARFESSQPCRSGGSRANLLVGATLDEGRRLSGDATYIACAFADPPFLAACGLQSVYATKVEATVSEDGATMSGEWLADGHWVTLSGGKPTGCRPDSTYDKLTSFTLTRCGSVDVSLTSTDNFRINTDPKMPELKATGNPPQSGASWETKVTYSRASGSCSGGPDFNSTTVEGKGADFVPTFDAVFGGELKVTAKTACGTVTKTERILGEDPGRPAIQAEIGTMEAPFDADDLKRIACQESRQVQFNGDGTPNVGGTGDFGIMQICYQRTTRDLWDWKYNIQRGRENLLEKVAFSRSMPRYWRQGQRTKTGVVYPRNGPFEEATDFTADELRMEAIKRYNAGNDLNRGYWEWDPLSQTWVANPLGGVPAYADQVIARTPACS